jgi:hypothetical protein
VGQVTVDPRPQAGFTKTLGSLYAVHPAFTRANRAGFQALKKLSNYFIEKAIMEGS